MTSDDFTCHCGNRPDLDGFGACNDDGVEVEPTPDAWNGSKYVCRACDAVYTVVTEDGLTMTYDVDGIVVDSTTE